MLNKNKKRAELIMGELIGRNTKIVESTDANKEGIHGKVIDETLNTLKIESEKEEKTVPKKTSTFQFKVNNDEIKINGKEILYRPEDRIKKNWRQYNDLYR